MASYGLFFAETDESADRLDSESDILDGEYGWWRSAYGSLEEITDYMESCFNDDDLPSSSGHWMRIIKIPDNSIDDGEKVVL